MVRPSLRADPVRRIGQGLGSSRRGAKRKTCRDPLSTTRPSYPGGGAAGANPADIAGGPVVVGDTVGMGALLEARGLRKAYKGEIAVDGIDLTVGPGERVGLLGPNGRARPPRC